jgi:hypothetical protein
MTSPSGIVPKDALTGLRLEAEDIGWGHGSGPVVKGATDGLLLASTGRATVLDALTGDRVPSCAAGSPTVTRPRQDNGHHALTNAWNEFLFASVFITKDEYKTLPVGDAADDRR